MRTTSDEWVLLEPDSQRPMYPSLGGASHSNQPPPRQHTTFPPSPPDSGGSSYYPTVGSTSFRGSGPSTSQPAQPHVVPPPQFPLPNGVTAQQTPILRVQIAEPYRIDPPVLLSRGLESIPRTQINFDFDLERRILAEAEQSGTPADSAQLVKDYDDPFKHIVESYVAMGYEREEVSLALAAFDGRVEQDKVVEFCRSFRQLKSMGFAAAHITGALLLHGDDISAATEACLSCQCC